MRYVFLYSANK